MENHISRLQIYSWPFSLRVFYVVLPSPCLIDGQGLSSCLAQVMTCWKLPGEVELLTRMGRLYRVVD